MKTYGLKKVRGIHNPDLLTQIEAQETDRLKKIESAIESADPPPKGTPGRQRIHTEHLARLRKRRAYKVKLIAAAAARREELRLLAVKKRLIGVYKTLRDQLQLMGQDAPEVTVDLMLEAWEALRGPPDKDGLQLAEEILEAVDAAIKEAAK